MMRMTALVLGSCWSSTVDTQHFAEVCVTFLKLQRYFLEMVFFRVHLVNLRLITWFCSWWSRWFTYTIFFFPLMDVNCSCWLSAFLVHTMISTRLVFFLFFLNFFLIHFKIRNLYLNINLYFCYQIYSLIILFSLYVRDLYKSIVRLTNVQQFFFSLFIMHLSFDTLR